MKTVPIIIDFTASGSGSESYPIEVGFSGRHGEGWCSLIRPESEWEFSAEAGSESGRRLSDDSWQTSTQQIAREVLIHRGKSALYVAQHLNTFLKGHTVYCDSVLHASIWLARVYDAASLIPQFELADFRAILSREQKVLWHIIEDEVKDELKINRHRASSIARVMQLTWLKTYDASRKSRATISGRLN